MDSQIYQNNIEEEGGEYALFSTKNVHFDTDSDSEENDLKNILCGKCSKWYHLKYVMLRRLNLQRDIFKTTNVFNMIGKFILLLDG